MKQSQTLAMLETGSSARVQTLQLDSVIRRRLQDIGLIENTLVQCVQKSPSGNPVAYRIRGAIIALRLQDAEKILLSSPEDAPCS